jgi:signal transduction histidine kinase/8-oxo-dGTP pyrophosphatase MutT (NUDIX family)
MMAGVLGRSVELVPWLHFVLLKVFKWLPPPLKARARQIVSTNWLLGVNAVIYDEEVVPAEILLVRHTYRKSQAWGLPAGVVQLRGHDKVANAEGGPQADVLEETLRREIREETGVAVEAARLVTVEALPLVINEPGVPVVDFYFRCLPDQGFTVLRTELKSGGKRPSSPEIDRIELVKVTELERYDLSPSHKRFLRSFVASRAGTTDFGSDLATLLRTLPDSLPLVNPEGAGGQAFRTLFKCVDVIKTLLEAECVTIFVRDQDDNLQIVAGLQEIAMQPTPPRIPLGAGGLTPWLYAQDEPQRLAAVALSDRYERQLSGLTLSHLKDRSRQSVLSAIIPGHATGQPSMGLVKVENKRLAGEPSSDGFFGADLRRIGDLAKQLLAQIHSIRDHHESCLGRRLNQAFRDVVAAIGSRKGAEQAVGSALEQLAPSADVSIWGYREDSVERRWSTESSSFKRPILEAESSGGVKTLRKDLEWLGSPEAGRAGAAQRLHLQKTCWLDNRPLYVIDVGVLVWQLLADSTGRAIESLMDFGGEFLRVASVREESLLMFGHELGTTLQAVLDYEFVFRQELDPDHELAHDLDDFSAVCRRWEDLVVRVQDFARIVTNEELPTYPERLMAGAVLGEVAQLWRKAGENRGVTLLVEDGVDASVEADARVLRTALSIGVWNALNASDFGSEVLLLAYPEADGVELLVRDAGHGMSEDEMRLFRLGRLTRRDPNRPGLGIGQLLLRSYARALGGELVCRARADVGGTVVGLKLPHTRVSSKEGR